MLMVVLDIVEKHIPHLEALNLDSNKIFNVENLNVLAQKFKKLRIIHIADNKVNKILLSQIPNTSDCMLVEPSFALVNNLRSDTYCTTLL